MIFRKVVLKNFAKNNSFLLENLRVRYTVKLKISNIVINLKLVT